MFLIPKAKWKPYEDAWFAKSPMGKHTLSLITRTLIIDLGLINKKITNKMSRGIGITRMEDHKYMFNMTC
jgi:hypothetical protein